MILNFEHYAEKGNEFINKVSYATDMERKQAAHFTAIVLHTIRDMISMEESLHLISQLPMFLKAVYVDGWSPSFKLKHLNSLEEFYSVIEERCRRVSIYEFSPNKLEHAVRQVIQVLRKYVDQGELNDVMAQLHSEVATLFEAADQ